MSELGFKEIKDRMIHRLNEWDKYMEATLQDIEEGYTPKVSPKLITTLFHYLGVHIRNNYNTQIFILEALFETIEIHGRELSNLQNLPNDISVDGYRELIAELEKFRDTYEPILEELRKAIEKSKEGYLKRDLPYE